MSALSKMGLVHEIEEHVGLEAHQALALVERCFTTITDTLAQGEAVSLTGLGKFVVRKKAARPGRNPRTGNAVPIAARRVVAFLPSTVFKGKLKKLCEKGKLSVS